MDRMRDAVLLLVNGLGTEAPVGLRSYGAASMLRSACADLAWKPRSPRGCEGHPSVVFSLYRDPVSKGFHNKTSFYKISHVTETCKCLARKPCDPPTISEWLYSMVSMRGHFFDIAIASLCSFYFWHCHSVVCL